jgi:hypothetical protein
MFSRLLTALTLALLASISRTGVSSAALLEDREDVMIATSLLVIGLMGLLLVIYLIKHALGLDKALPPLEPEADPHAAGHSSGNHAADHAGDDTVAEHSPEREPVGHH